MRKILSAILSAAILLGVSFSAPKVATAQVAQQYCCYGNPTIWTPGPGGTPTPAPTASPTPAPTPTPPPVLLAFQYSNGGAGGGTETGNDPGSTADEATLWGEESLSQTGSLDNAVYSNCHVSCHSFVYTEMTDLLCNNSSVEGSYWQYLSGSHGGPHEAGFYHPYGGGTTAPTSASRLTVATKEGHCNSAGNTTSDTTCPSTVGGVTTYDTCQVRAMNPLDLTGTQCIYNVWATSSTSCGWSITGPIGSVAVGQGISEDNVAWAYACPCWGSSEFGNGYGFQLPTGTYGYTQTWASAYGTFVNSMCQTVCIPWINKTNMQSTLSCNSVITIGGVNHCANSTQNYCGNCLDNRMDYDGLCATLTKHNFLGMLMEDLVDRDASGSVPGGIAQLLDTIAYLQANDHADDCGKMVFPIEEAQYAYYSEAVGVVWLMPNPYDGYPDLIKPWLIIDCNCSTSSSDVAYFPMYEVVPWGAEEVPTVFNFNGLSTATSNGTYCNSATADVAPNENSGDSGGVQAIAQWCPDKTHPVLVIQYHHHAILSGLDLGPAAAVVNTSNTTDEVIKGNWFIADPASTYKHVIVYPTCSGYPCEGAYIPSGYAGSLLSALQAWNTNCTSTTYCIGRGTNPAASAAIDMTSTAFSCSTTSPYTCNITVPKHSAVFLTSQ